MSDLVHFEFPPPKSWEQFEELCADLFEVMWSDSGLVRHGRAGQTQNGIDIVASRSGVTPIGLQCKKKARWPLKKLSYAEVKREVDEADKFSPALKEFYILTTALSDARLDEQVLALNATRLKAQKFQVFVLPWSEIVRRIARYDQVAEKHFPLGTSESFSPLLATWYTREGNLELTGEDWAIAAQELGEDFNDWPTGHLVVRQRETDELVARLRQFDRAAKFDRKKKLELRRELRRARDREADVARTIHRLYTNDYLKVYMLEVYEQSAPQLLRGIIQNEMRRDLENAGEYKIRLRPPSPEKLSGPFSSNSVAKDDIALTMSLAQYTSILELEEDFPKRFYGNRMIQAVMELPEEIQFGMAMPVIFKRVERIMREDKKTAQEME